jgi:8-oxo-dGTP diphosphatase
MLLLRHAWAGDRAEWEGDDKLRPLDDRGRQQANDLVEALARFPVEAILTSPAVRCVQTVEPLAAARGLDIDLRAELGEDRQQRDGAALVHSLAGRDVVICGHGGLEVLALPDRPKWKKAATLVLDADLRVLETIRV